MGNKTLQWILFTLASISMQITPLFFHLKHQFGEVCFFVLKPPHAPFPPYIRCWVVVLLSVCSLVIQYKLHIFHCRTMYCLQWSNLYWKSVKYQTKQCSYYITWREETALFQSFLHIIHMFGICHPRFTKLSIVSTLFSAISQANLFTLGGTCSFRSRSMNVRRNQGSVFYCVIY